MTPNRDQNYNDSYLLLILLEINLNNGFAYNFDKTVAPTLNSKSPV